MLKAEKLTAHAPYHVTYSKGVKNNNIFEIHKPNFTLHCNFYGAPMKNKGCLLMRPLMLR